ncbi:hypothetical protein ACWGJB_40945 [Streptomyces sp. NPDC054813]
MPYDTGALAAFRQPARSWHDTKRPPWRAQESLEKIDTLDTADPELRRFLLDGQGDPPADRVVGHRDRALLTLAMPAATATPPTS